MTDYIKFHKHHTQKILNGEKWLTARYGWDEAPSPGETVVLRNREDKFAEALITFATPLTIRQFVEKDFDGHRKYDNPEAMCEAMETFYPDEKLNPDDEVLLIGFDVTKKCKSTGINWEAQKEMDRDVEENPELYEALTDNNESSK